MLEIFNSNLIDIYSLILHSNQTFTILYDLKPIQRGPFRKEILTGEENGSSYNTEFGAFAFEIWQLKSGTLFDALIVTDDINEAREAGLDFLKRRDNIQQETKPKENENQSQEEEEHQEL